ncbi:helix-turn-helix domain-containing protein [Thioclava sp. BHET1]|nr:helix-turn-helix domain-containing protein [Thioclava sp. BHET1]
MTQHFALVPVEELTALRADIRALKDAMDGCRIVPAPKWVNITEAAKTMDCHPATVRRMITEGRIEARGSGRRRQVRVGT